MRIEHIYRPEPLICRPEDDLGKAARIMRNTDVGTSPCVKRAVSIVSSASFQSGISCKRWRMPRICARGMFERTHPLGHTPPTSPGIRGRLEIEC